MISANSFARTSGDGPEAAEEADWRRKEQMMKPVLAEEYR